MLTVDIGKLPAEIAAMFMVRNPESAPLRWQAHPNRRGKNTLDETSDEQLFGDVPVLNDSMASGVRALLYAWNGWLEDAKMYAQPAPPAERAYIIAVCERMIGRADAASSLFREMAVHAIAPDLVSCVLELTTATSNPVVQSFRQDLQEEQVWDHLAFMELVNQARMERLGLAGEQLVSLLQCKEFELLFCHCFRGATGVQLAMARKEETATAPRKVRKVESRRSGPARGRRTASVESRTRTLDLAEPRPKPDAPARSQAQAQPEPAFQVVCPKCGTTVMLPGQVRGSRTKCTRCSAVFVASQNPASPPDRVATSRPQASSSTVFICCPLCGGMHTLPPSSRGTNQQCAKCRTIFSVPRQ
jgi:hypothetical protein